MKVENAKELKVKSLESLNDSDSYIAITEDNISMRGDHIYLVGLMADALMGENAFFDIVSDALELIVKMKLSKKT